MLRGNTLSQIMFLKDLTNINLSDNPLETFDFDKWVVRLLDEGDLIIKRLKLKSIDFEI